MAKTQNIILRDMRFTAPLDYDSWGRPSKPSQPIRFSITIVVPLASTTKPEKAEASSNKDVVAVDYSQIASLVLAVARSPAAPEPLPQETDAAHQDALAFHQSLAGAIFDKWDHVSRIYMETILPIGIDGAAADAVWHSNFTRRIGLPLGHIVTLTLRDIRASTMIGLRQHEKGARQTVLTSVRFNIILSKDPMSTLSYLPAGDPLQQYWAAQIISVVQSNTHETVEGLINSMAAHMKRKVDDVHRASMKGPESPLERIMIMTWLRVVKTDALQFVDGAGVEMEFD